MKTANKIFLGIFSLALYAAASAPAFAGGAQAAAEAVKSAAKQGADPVGEVTPKSNPAQDLSSPAPDKISQPPDQTPSGTKPAEPANPGENSATPAQPGAKDKTDAAKNGDNGQPGDAAKDKTDNTDKDDKNDNSDKSNKGEKKGHGKHGGLKGISLHEPSAAQGGAAAAGAGFLGGIFGGGKDKDKKEAAPEAEASTTTIISTAAPEGASTPTAAAPAEPLFSDGKGPKIAVMDFAGDGGAQFTALLAAALKPELKVYSRAALALKKYDSAAVNRVSARKIGASMGVDYIVTGKIDKETDTLSVIAVFLRSVSTGDIKMTDFIPVRAPATVPAQAPEAAKRIERKI